MDIGKLNKVVRFDKNVPVPSTAGWSDVYTELLTTYGYMKKVNGSRSLSFNEVVNENTYDLWVNYQQLLEDNLRSDIKVNYDGKLFTIQTWEKVEEKRFLYHFVVTETGRYSGNPSPGSPFFVDMPLYLTGTSGNSVQNDLLIGVTIFLVMREHIGQDQVSGTPGNAQFVYDSTLGTITFNNDFNPAGESVYILYKK